MALGLNQSKSRRPRRLLAESIHHPTKPLWPTIPCSLGTEDFKKPKDLIKDLKEPQDLKDTKDPKDPTENPPRPFPPTPLKRKERPCCTDPISTYKKKGPKPAQGPECSSLPIFGPRSTSTLASRCGMSLSPSW